MLEKVIEREMCQAFTRRGAWALKMEGTVTGLPDRLIVLPGGRCIWVELKQEKGRLSERQKVVIRKLQELDQEVRVVYGIEQALALVNEVMPVEVIDDDRQG